MSIKRTGSAVWKGDLQSGKGTVSTQSGVLKDQAYGFKTRFEDGPGTNPEELIGASHAGCFSMALSLMLADHDLVADEIRTSADVTLSEAEGGGFEISKIHLTVAAKIPGASQDAFDKATQAAKEGCPISKLMTAPITMDATLEG